MGAITVIFAPLYAVFVLFSSIFGIVSGNNTANVALPYDPENGVVWEYDNIDDPYIKLTKTEIKDGEQIFYFAGNTSHFYNALYDGDYLDLIFTDKNGNTLKYYAFIYEEGISLISKIKILAPDEYIEYVYDIVPQTQHEQYRWVVDIDNNIKLNTDVIAPKNSFTVVYDKGSDSGEILNLYFRCISLSGNADERYKIHVDFSSGEGVLISENIEIIDQTQSEVNEAWAR